jgi:hypothetical protein
MPKTMRMPPDATGHVFFNFGNRSLVCYPLAMPESSTPLSDCISRYVEECTDENYQRFLRAFLCSQLGVIGVEVGAGGTPAVISSRVPGRYVMGKGEGLAVSTTPDGRKTILACADRATYVQHFDHQFNGEIDAIELLKAAWKTPDCEGIRINSAASEHSIVIPRERIGKLIEGETQGESAKPRSRLASWFSRHW